jgi:hypothetical protein
MFLATFNQVKARTEHIDELLAEYRQRITPANIKTEAVAIVREILREYHFLTANQEELLIYRAYRPFQKNGPEVRQVIQAMHNAGLCNEMKCPECEGACQASEEEEERPTGPIDRSGLPTPPLAITGDAVAQFMRDIHGWLSEAWEELLESPLADLPAAPARYLIGDLDQVMMLASYYKQLQELSEIWDSIIQTEGPEWTSDRVGVRRLDVLSRVQAIYLAMANPEAPRSRVLHGLFGAFGL